jgi:1,4-dihydroxy-2-naphthoyl-CoA synthase
MTVQPDYFSATKSLTMTRDADGVLTVSFQRNGQPLTFTAQDHTELVEAFYRIAQDRANTIVILTGSGGDFIPGIDFSSFGDVTDPAVLSRIHDEGVQILENLLNIRVPVIAAVEGRIHVHSELARMYLKVPELTRRATRIHFTQPLKERIVREVGYGLALESLSALDLGRSMRAR